MISLGRLATPLPFIENPCCLIEVDVGQPNRVEQKAAKIQTETLD